jgi:hypothetical protein
MAIAHGMDRHAHRCVAGPSQGLAGLVLAADDILCVEDLDGRTQIGMAVERAADLGGSPTSRKRARS